ncbi:MAG: PspC domain-containing protein, partial [Candidatus Limnocylindrales bacterium]
MNPRRLYRSRDHQIAGVAGGMAEYLDVDPTVIRIGWILVTVVTGGLALIAYLLLALVIPMSPYAAGPYWTGQPTPTAGWAGAPAAPGSTGAPGSSAG